jgi:hypothetical protein
VCRSEVDYSGSGLVSILADINTALNLWLHKNISDLLLVINHPSSQVKLQAKSQLFLVS